MAAVGESSQKSQASKALVPVDDVVVDGRRLSAILHELRKVSRGKRFTCGQIQAHLRGRGAAVLIIVLALPFCLPITIPGVGVPFGVAIAALGLRVAFRKRLWLPRWLQQRALPPKALERVLNWGIWAAQKMERVAQPRLFFLHNWPGMKRLIGITIAASGLLLCLPLPIPFTNTMPGIAIVLLTIGLMERDGLVVLAGYLMAIAGPAYLTALFILGKLGIENLSDVWPGM